MKIRELITILQACPHQDAELEILAVDFDIDQYGNTHLNTIVEGPVSFVDDDLTTGFIWAHGNRTTNE